MFIVEIKKLDGNNFLQHRTLNRVNADETRNNLSVLKSLNWAKSEEVCKIILKTIKNTYRVRGGWK